MSESVHKPNHYIEGLPVEAIEIIEMRLEAVEVDRLSQITYLQNKGRTLFNYGNALKYLLRAGIKGDFIEDLKKARNYLNRAIDGCWYKDRDFKVDIKVDPTLKDNEYKIIPNEKNICKAEDFNDITKPGFLDEVEPDA